MVAVLQFQDELTDDEQARIDRAMIAPVEQGRVRERIAGVLGDGWCMDDPADKAAAVDAVMQVVAEEAARLLPG